MANMDFVLRQLPGSEVVDKLAGTARHVFPKHRFTLTIETNVIPQLYQEQNLDPNEAAGKKRLDEIKKELADRPYLICRQIRTDGFPHSCHMTYTCPDGIVAKLRVSIEDAAERSLMLEIATAIGKHFKIESAAEIISASLPEPIQQQIKYREQTVADLQAAVAQLGVASTQMIERQEKLLQEKYEGLDKRYQAKENQLDAEHKARSEVLDRREEEHRQKVADFETHESKYVRRQLLDKMREMIEQQEKVTLSPETIRKRRVIHVAFIVPMISGLALAGVFAYKVFTSATPDWHCLAPTSAGILMFATTLIYYIKWNDQWFKEHAQAEFRNMRFSADILRASWLAELLFEWEREKERELPESVIASFSRNLFHDERWTETEHPVEAVGKLLGSISTVRVSGKEGVEITRKPTKP